MLFRSKILWWFILTVICAISAIWILDIRRYYGLVERGVETKAEVISKDPENHRMIHYAYTVDGRRYTWGGYAGDISRDFNDVNIGDIVRADYDPVKPSFSTLGDPNPQFRSLIRGAIFVTLCPTILWLCYLGQRAFRNR